MEMKMKGYTYQQETSRQVGLEAMKNGIAGSGGSANVLGDLAGLGIGLGAMSGVMGITKDAMNPIVSEAGSLGQGIGGAISGAWDCACGQKGITGNFCSNCGAKRPSPGWDCECGQKGITGNFCSNCGKKRAD